MLSLDTFSDIDPYEGSSVDDLSSMSGSGANAHPETEEDLKKAHGISRDVGVSLDRASLDVVAQYKKQLYKAPGSDAEKLKQLRKGFRELVDRLVTDEDLRDDFVDGETADDVLEKFLRQLGEEPVQFANGSSELNHFRHNLQTFLRLVIKTETLEIANHQAESVDEVVHNLLYFPYDLK